MGWFARRSCDACCFDRAGAVYKHIMTSVALPIEASLGICGALAAWFRLLFGLTEESSGVTQPVVENLIAGLAKDIVDNRDRARRCHDRSRAINASLWNETASDSELEALVLSCDHLCTECGETARLMAGVRNRLATHGIRHDHDLQETMEAIKGTADESRRIQREARMVLGARYALREHQVTLVELAKL